MSNPIFFVCMTCKKPGYEEPSYKGNSVVHKACSEVSAQKQDLMRQIEEQYDPTKIQARMFFEKDYIVIDHPFHLKLNNAYKKYFAFKTWNPTKKRREVKKSKINSINGRFLIDEIQFTGPEYNWVKDPDVLAFLNEKAPPASERQETIKKLSEIKKNFEADTDVSHLKLPLMGYQKAGVAFLEAAEGVAFVADSMGLGKCLIKSSIYVNKGLFLIEDLFSQFAENAPYYIDKDGGEWFKTKLPIKCISVGPNGEQQEKLISSLYREKVKTKIKKVNINDGTNLHLTIPHKLLTLNEWKNDFKVGDHILLPRNIKDHSETKTIDPRLNLFFSWLISEGNEDSRRHSIMITQKDKSILDIICSQVIEYCVSKGIKINNPSVYLDERNNCHRLAMHSVEFHNHLSDLGYVFGNKSKDKKIPNIVLNSTEKEISFFLKNYFEAEASVLKTGVIEISTASERLSEDLKFMLRRIGVLIRFHPTQKMATNGLRIKRTYYYGIIGGTSLRTFQTKVGFVSKEKNEKLANLCSKDCNDNIDIVPTLDICQEINKMNIPDNHTGIHNVYTLTQNLSRQTLPVVIKNLDDIISGKFLESYKKLKPSRWTNQTLEIYKNIDYKKLKSLRDALEYRLNQNVFYLKVNKIDYYDYEGYVYDLTVDDNHNYIANGVYCHNTVQALGYTSKLKQKTIIVTLASVKYNWKNEVEKFTNCSSIVIHDKSTIEELNKYDYVITNYEQLKKWEPVLKKMKFDTIILDESHSIANGASQRSKLVFKLFKKVKHRILLSGTPTRNKPMELFYQLKFLNPSEFSNKQDFGFRYCGPSEGYNGHWEFKGSSNLDELNERIAPFYIRRLKEEVLKDLPPKRISNLIYEMNKDDRKEYDLLVAEIEKNKETQESILGRPVREKANGLMSLMKFCSHKKVPFVVEYVKQMIQEDLTSNKKIVIFAHFRETQKLLAKAFDGIAITLFSDMKDYERQAAVDKFTSEPNLRVFIGSTIAAGTGINLTVADTVIFADLLWTPAIMKQCEDRVHRYLQKNSTFIYYMTFDHSVEKAIWSTLEKKLLVTAQTHGDVEIEEDVVVNSISKLVFMKNKNNSKD
jgi:intein/homing endonuclease